MNATKRGKMRSVITGEDISRMLDEMAKLQDQCGELRTALQLAHDKLREAIGYLGDEGYAKWPSETKWFVKQQREKFLQPPTQESEARE